eukprot:CAMPEP_0171275992 /NCGR_PEP_ID=MMETSP0790-20130122/63610_1 /TAXON_ID=2925 /ORGANISM="Alexandrium catenella, Strain OF101" /LENGTH=78 /DNA_ID=CAMNT_0011745077 /DNA_START=94 /DNA_END=326 /DNA_ORIENTATION=-
MRDNVVSPPGQMDPMCNLSWSTDLPKTIFWQVAGMRHSLAIACFTLQISLLGSSSNSRCSPATFHTVQWIMSVDWAGG